LRRAGPIVLSSPCARRAEIPSRGRLRTDRDLILSGPWRRVPNAVTASLPRAPRVAQHLMDAFDQLLAEGYVQTRVGPARTWQRVRGSVRARCRRFAGQPRGVSALSYRPCRLRSGCRTCTGFPSRPGKRLSRASGTTYPPRSLLQPAEGRGVANRVARYIGTYRGVRCHPDQILVTGEPRRPFGIVSRLLLRSGASTCVLETRHAGHPAHVSGLGGKIVPARVDNTGWTRTGFRRDWRPRHSTTYPSSPVPLGERCRYQRRDHAPLTTAPARTLRGGGRLRPARSSKYATIRRPSARSGADPSGRLHRTSARPSAQSMRIGSRVFPLSWSTGQGGEWFHRPAQLLVDQLILPIPCGGALPEARGTR